ncbi:MAG: PepSY domain-containing protein [Chloroflexi bacterium]|nr:PepSY domain-containing protein [Chloroflexota bacterium]MCI0576164.1 PepSY domain-containing protein [Chloroflexota bacterium]MCI0645433.1 PepSY domain-containing protein [Chloroflexota bacterium]MCI0731299.1 PepSY domain-containing protein [Chloroflexota bacterium]
MMKSIAANRRLVIVVLLAGLLLGAVFAGAMAFNGTPVLAQPGGGDETEDEAGDGDDDAEGPDVPITGTALEQASAAALDYIGEGRVTDTEVGDEEGYYEIEITRDDGRQVDVHLDEAFNVLGHEDD